MRQNQNKSTISNFLEQMTFVSLICFSSAVFLGKMYDTVLSAWDEGDIARLALRATTHLFPPQVPIQTGYNEHPFTMFYLYGLVERLFGPSSWSTVLLAGLISVLTIVVTYFLGSKSGNSLRGLIAGLVLATTVEYVSEGSRAHLDIPMILFILISFVGWQRRSLLITAAGAGLGLWLKNPVSFLIFPAAALQLYWAGGRKRDLYLLFKSFALASLIGSLVWLYSGYTGGWNLISDYWMRQVYGTAILGRGEHNMDLFMLPKTLTKLYWPWFPFLISALIQIFRKKLWKRPDEALYLGAISTVAVVISLVAWKTTSYFLPIYPFFALVIAGEFSDWGEKRKEQVQSTFICLTAILLAVFLVLPISRGKNQYRNVVRASAIIRNYGLCSDTIAYVADDPELLDMASPFNEMRILFAFYADRKLVFIPCHKADHIIADSKPSWIFGSQQKIEQCLSREGRSPYQEIFKDENSVTLSRNMPKGEPINLELFDKELQAPVDCKIQ